MPKRNQHLLRTSYPTSHGYTFPSERGRLHDGGKTDFELLFEFVATTDDTPYMCVPAAIKFREEVCGGDSAVQNYIQDIAQRGGDLVAGILGTSIMQEPGLSNASQSDIRKCAMVNVRMPLGFKDGVLNEHVPNPNTSPYQLFSVDDAGKMGSWMENTLITEFDTFAKFYPHGGWLWLRLSGQIYLDMDDFEWIGHVVAQLCERVAKGEWLQR